MIRSGLLLRTWTPLPRESRRPVAQPTGQSRQACVTRVCGQAGTNERHVCGDARLPKPHGPHQLWRWDLLAWTPPIRVDPTLRPCSPGAATPVPPRYPLPEQHPESLPQAQGGQRGLARGGSWPVGPPCLTGGPCPGLRPPTNSPQRLCAGQLKSPESCCLQCPCPNLWTGWPPGSPSGCSPPTGQAQVEEAHPFYAEESHPVTVTKRPLRG